MKGQPRPKKPNPLPFFYGWLIVAASFLALGTYGAFYSFGIFLKPMAAEFHWSRGETSTAFSIYMAVYTLSAILMGWMADRWGPRLPLVLASFLIGIGIALSGQVTSLWQLYLLYGVIAAVGFGAVFVVPLSTTVRWFATRRGMASGIAASGQGVSIFAMPLVANWLINAYDWRVAFLAIGIAFFTINFIAAMVLRRDPEEVGLTPYGATGSEHQEPLAPSLSRLPSPAKDLTVKETVTTRPFWMLYIAFALIIGGERMVAVHLAAFATDIGISSAIAAGALGMIGIGRIFGNLVMGPLSDRIGRKSAWIICSALISVTILGLGAVNNAATAYLLIVFLGFSYGGLVAVFGPLIGEFFGLTHMGKIMGIFFTCGTISGLIGPTLAGYLYDFTGSYDRAFLFGGMFCALAIILSLFVRPPLRTAGPPQRLGP
ncbi:MAG: MFS transporter [Dehalococcoidia bacterium]